MRLFVIKIYLTYINTLRQAFQEGDHCTCLLMLMLLMGIEHPLLSVTAHSLIV